MDHRFGGDLRSSVAKRQSSPSTLSCTIALPRAHSRSFSAVCGQKKPNAPCWTCPSQKHLTVPSAVGQTAGSSLSTLAYRCMWIWVLPGRSSSSTTPKRPWKSIRRYRLYLLHPGARRTYLPPLSFHFCFVNITKKTHQNWALLVPFTELTLWICPGKGLLYGQVLPSFHGRADLAVFSTVSIMSLSLSKQAQNLIRDVRAQIPIMTWETWGKTGLCFSTFSSVTLGI